MFSLCKVDILEVIALILTMYNLRLCSFNSRGFNVLKREYIRQLLLSSDVLFLQEHWLSDGQLTMLGDLDTDFTYTGVSGFGNNDVLAGRPYGGCAILLRASLNFSVQFLSVDSRRISAIRLTSDQYKLLLVNVYMPYEDRNCNIDEFSDVLFQVESLLVNNIDCHYIIGGDYNVDISRDTVHTALLRSFSDSHSLLYASDFPGSNVDFTYHFNMSRFSNIDNFMMSPFIFHNVLTCFNVIHHVDNLSDHEPVVIVLQLPVDIIVTRCIKGTNSQKVSWTKANNGHIDNYRRVLVDELHSICLPVTLLTCCDRRCQSLEHVNDVSSFASDIASACIKAGVQTLPKQGTPKRCIPGFSEHVEPYREKSMFWHRIWMDCGKPRTGHVADCMRRTRAAYHYAVRSVKRNEDAITRTRFADALVNNHTRNFWSEVKKIRASKVSGNGIIDGHSDADEIAQLFCNKYRALYNSVAYDEHDMNNINEMVDTNIDDDNFCDFIVSPLDVSVAISNLKHCKTDVDCMLTSDHFIYAPNDLHVHISLLFSAMLMHGCVPNLFFNSSIRPIPKGHNLSTADSGNYRGIAIGSLFNKIFDHVILLKYRNLLSTIDLQFGFKKNHSTQMCTMVLKETISYYLSNKSNVFCTFLDATKAFDRINYCRLFRMLINRSLPYCIIRSLLNLYVHNYVCVSWAGTSSTTFLASNGVKQGGVLSPVLFCIYMDGLLQRLASVGVGCYMGDLFVGALAYADDIVLVAPTPGAMTKMLAVCSEFALEYNVLFNASKSKSIYLHTQCRSRSLLHVYDVSNLKFTISGYDIEFVDSYKHLGHIISNEQTDSVDILEKRSVFVGQANNILCYFSKLSSDVKYRLFTSFCSSFFGCELWRLDCSSMAELCTAWRKAMRRIYSLPNTTHSCLLPLLSNCLPLFDQFCNRFLNFMRRCISDNSSILVRTVVWQGLLHSRSFSTIGLNFMYCMRRYNFVLSDFINGSISVVQHHASSSDWITANFLKELIYLRDGTLTLSGGMCLDRNDLSLIIEHVSTS